MEVGTWRVLVEVVGTPVVSEVGPVVTDSTPLSKYLAP